METVASGMVEGRRKEADVCIADLLLKYSLLIAHNGHDTAFSCYATSLPHCLAEGRAVSCLVSKKKNISGMDGMECDGISGRKIEQEGN